MGHVHTLTRAILRDPERWMYRTHTGLIYAHGAYRSRLTGAWEPRGWYHAQPYHPVVRHVLSRLGYTIRDS